MASFRILHIWLQQIIVCGDCYWSKSVNLYIEGQMKFCITKKAPTREIKSDSHLPTRSKSGIPTLLTSWLLREKTDKVKMEVTAVSNVCDWHQTNKCLVSTGHWGYPISQECLPYSATYQLNETGSVADEYVAPSHPTHIRYSWPRKMRVYICELSI